MRRYPLALIIGMAVLTITVGLPAQVAAHCDGIVGNIVVVPKCAVHTPLEDAVVQANAALGGSLAVVLVKDFRFHPENVTIRNGGTVLFLYADVHSNEIHDPRSSGSCGSQAADLAKCSPPAPAECFDAIVDQGGVMDLLGETYPLTFRYTAASGAIERSNSIMAGSPVVGEPPFAKPWLPCPPGTSSNTPSDALIPYHCGIHGGSTTSIRAMRGTIRVVA